MITEAYNYTVYNKNTGAYVKSMYMPTKEDALLNISKNDILVEGDFAENTKYVDGLIKNATVVKEVDNFITKAALITKAVLNGLIPVSSVGSIMKGDFPSFFDITELSVKENIEYRIWWAQNDKLYFDDPMFKHCMLNSKLNMKDLVN